MKEAIVVFDPREERFKHPYGAIRSNSTLMLRIFVHSSVDVKEVRLVFLYDRHDSPARYTLKKGETSGSYTAYEVTFPVHDTGLYWYHFEIETGSGLLHVARSWDGYAEVNGDDTRDWQQTVYQRKYEEPSWLYGGVIYHIFVDRFCCVGERVHQEGKICREDWGGEPIFRPENGQILNNDFFGGNLRGIISKLPYLEDLGVTCLYLSPIFEAYSSHKYDTGNYMKIDPAFGTEEDFRELCRLAGERGIRVILDGVFAHTGSDSVYFNKYGHYGSGGAWQDPESPYRDWYEFRPDGSYESWWGIDTLPRLNKREPSYRTFITGKNGVARKWLAAGASGWRLDVADELPNSFLEELAAAVKKEKPDAILLGEVWEDASTKIAYDERKNYFEGDKLDSVMNYPVKNAIIDFVRYGNSAFITFAVEQLTENYPPEVLDSLMNILGTHDTCRIITALAGKYLPEGTDREIEAVEKLSEEEWKQGIRLLKIAAAIQMTLPGVPCVYYGDEAGVEGYHDPFNRRCFPWGHENKELQDWYRKIIRIRRSHPVYQCGHYRTAAALNGLYAFERYGLAEVDGETITQRMITAANCGETVEELMLFGTWRELIRGTVMKGNVTIFPGEIMILEKIKPLEEEDQQ